MQQITSDMVITYSEEIKPELVALTRHLYHHPELGHEEIIACESHVSLLKKYNFEIQDNYMNMPTAFRATYDSGRTGPTVCLMSEYDALPGIGHGCGHNILGATSTGAGIVISKLMAERGLAGKVVVLGTPAEETSGGKVVMVDGGAFDTIDVAIMAHPSDAYVKSGASLAMEALEFKFIGRTAHAAASPEKGINALDAVINTFVSINALRQHVLPSARIHGVITKGGEAANVIPDLAIAQFYVRATHKSYLNELVEKVKNCARAAALSTRATLEIRNYETSYDNMVHNDPLSETFVKHLKSLGVDEIKTQKDGYGSLDAGNVSQVVPTIHPYFDICGKPTTGHSTAFAEATRTEYAHDNMCIALSALACTAAEVIENEALLISIKKAFEQAEK